MIGKEFKKELVENGINPLDVKKFTSKYNRSKGIIITKILLEDNSERIIESKMIWYAARKNKKW